MSESWSERLQSILEEQQSRGAARSSSLYSSLYGSNSVPTRTRYGYNIELPTSTRSITTDYSCGGYGYDDAEPTNTSPAGAPAETSDFVAIILQAFVNLIVTITVFLFNWVVKPIFFYIVIPIGIAYLIFRLYLTFAPDAAPQLERLRQSRAFQAIRNGPQDARGRVYWLYLHARYNVIADRIFLWYQYANQFITNKLLHLCVFALVFMVIRYGWMSYQNRPKPWTELDGFEMPYYMQMKRNEEGSNHFDDWRHGHEPLAFDEAVEYKDVPVITAVERATITIYDQTTLYSYETTTLTDVERTTVTNIHPTTITTTIPATLTDCEPITITKEQPVLQYNYEQIEDITERETRTSVSTEYFWNGQELRNSQPLASTVISVEFVTTTLTKTEDAPGKDGRSIVSPTTVTSVEQVTVTLPGTTVTRSVSAACEQPIEEERDRRRSGECPKCVQDTREHPTSPLTTVTSVEHVTSTSISTEYVRDTEEQSLPLPSTISSVKQVTITLPDTTVTRNGPAPEGPREQAAEEEERVRRTVGKGLTWCKKCQQYHCCELPYH